MRGSGLSSPPHRFSRWSWLASGMVVTVLFAGLIMVPVLPTGNGKDQAPAPGEVDSSDRPAKPSPPVDDDFTADEPIVLVDKTRPIFRVKGDIEVDAVGNATVKEELRLPLGELELLKKRLSWRLTAGRCVKCAPKVTQVLRLLNLKGFDSVIEKLDGKFQNEDEVINLNWSEIGWAKHRDERWVSLLSPDPANKFHLVKKHKTSVTLRGLREDDDNPVLFEVKVTLPSGAHNIDVKDWPNLLVYDAPPPGSVGAVGAAKPDVSLETKPIIMSALYKLYSNRRFHDLWVARSVFRNSTRETLHDYRVRFRVQGYSEWSHWERSDVIYPGQTVVDPFYPVIDKRVMELKNTNPVDLEMEYTYVRPDGDPVKDKHTKRVWMMGSREAVFSDVPLKEDESTWLEIFKDAPRVLASFTSANDPVIRDVVGIVQKMTGGENPQEDKGARRFLEELYNLMGHYIRYDTPPGDWLDGHKWQLLKYGRDVLEAKSGTCIDTSIFYASVAEAAGLDAYIFLIPGHAFPAVRLPESKEMLCVESTAACSEKHSLPFRSSPDQEVSAVMVGRYKLLKAIADGRLVTVNIRKLRRAGVTPPELPDLGKNPLDDWHITIPAPAGTNRRPSSPPASGTPPSSKPLPGPAAESPTAAQLVGIWKGRYCTFQLNANGTFCYILNGKPYIQHIGYFTIDNRLYGTWSYEDKTLTLNYSSGLFNLPSSREVFWYKKGSALLVGGEVWTRVP